MSFQDAAFDVQGLSSRRSALVPRQSNKASAERLTRPSAMATSNGDPVSRHAAALSGHSFAKAGSKAEARFAAEINAATEALIATPTAGLMTIAYKLSEACRGAEPEFQHLDSTTCKSAIDNTALDTETRLVASAFRDLIGLTEVAERQREEKGRGRATWNQIMSDVDEARAAVVAVPDPIDDESQAAWDDKYDVLADQEMRLNRSFAPDLLAVLTKHYQVISADQYTYETLDDALARYVEHGDWTVQLHAYTYMDMVALLQREGSADELVRDRFFPRAMIARLERLGCDFKFDGFGSPDGIKSEAFDLISSLSKEQFEDLRGAAWLAEYLENGGSFHTNGARTELWRGQSCCPSTERSLVLGRAVDEAKANPSPTCDLMAGIRRVVRGRMEELGVNHIEPSDTWREIEDANMAASPSQGAWEE